MRGWTILYSALAGYNLNTALQAASEGRAWSALIGMLAASICLAAAVLMSREPA